MKLTIQIEMGNAAFEDDCAGNEVARILRKLAGVYEDSSLDDFEDNTGSTYHLRDINGNRVGSAKVSA